MLTTKNKVEQIGEAFLNFSSAIKYILTGKINIENTANQIVKAGNESLFIVSITAVFIGLAMSVQLAQELSRNFGAAHLVGGLIALATIRELGPVLTAIVIAGRVGAAISAEIGSMKASEQINALIVLGIDPIRYLLVPRLIACAITCPLLTATFAYLAIIAGMFLTKLSVGLNYNVYMNSVRQFIVIDDIYIMIFKSIIFGMIISILATTSGLQVEGGAEEVGEAATNTVVRSIILVFIVNFLLTEIFFGA